MTRRSDKTYQDPSTAGSLSSALRLWKALRARRRETAIAQIAFTLSCWSESRAARVAAFLRRRRACAVTRVHRVAGGTRDAWHVDGSMTPAIHTLTDLEAVWTWLRRAAHSHQVTLLRITLASASA